MYIVTSKMEMEQIKKLAREQGVDLAVQGLVCLPREIKKYVGSIARYQKKGGVLYGACIQYKKDLKCSATFETEAKAEQYICDVNLREGLPIRNQFTVFEDRVEVELPGGKILICNVDNLYFVELHNWCCSSYGLEVCSQAPISLPLCWG